MTILAILWLVRGIATPGDIASALNSNPDPEVYTLSLGHMTDLTIASFAYLRLPLCVAGVAFAIGAIGAWAGRKSAPLAALTAMMVLFFHAARLALVVFDPYLSSRPLAEALLQAPPPASGGDLRRHRPALLAAFRARYGCASPLSGEMP